MFFFPHDSRPSLTALQSRGLDIGFTSEGNWGRSGAGILVASGQKILLLKRSEDVVDSNLWGIPGGARRETRYGLESALTTAVTETREELGILPKGKIRSTPFFYRKPGSKFSYYTYVLEAEEPFTPQLNWEHTEARWVDRAAAPGL